MFDQMENEVISITMPGRKDQGKHQGVRIRHVWNRQSVLHKKNIETLNSFYAIGKYVSW